MNKLKNQELLRRIEKLETLTERLEQGIVEIRNACSCLTKELEDNFNIPKCEPMVCEDCNNYDCVCEEESTEEEEPTEDHD